MKGELHFCQDLRIPKNQITFDITPLQAFAVTGFILGIVAFVRKDSGVVMNLGWILQSDG
ncbi:MAG: hypothetical protein ABRQ25_15265 [Clostridiaceae bacterium]